jgi:hypothetical protein
MIALTRVAPVTRQIVGVVAPIRRLADGSDSEQVYVPLTQDAWANSTIVVRPRDGVAATPLTSAVQAAIARVDPEHPSRGFGRSPRSSGGRSRGRGSARRS